MSSEWAWRLVKSALSLSPARFDSPTFSLSFITSHLDDYPVSVCHTEVSGCLTMCVHRLEKDKGQNCCIAHPESGWASSGLCEKPKFAT